MSEPTRQSQGIKSPQMQVNKSQDKYFTNKIFPNKKLEEEQNNKFGSSTNENDYLKTITKLNDKIIADAIKEQDLSSSMALLKQLQGTIQNASYGNFSMNKKNYHYHLYVCHYNMALIQQNLSNSRNSVEDHKLAYEYMEQALKNYELMQGYIINREENIVFIFQLIRTQLQFCGILSHFNKHEEAITYSQKSLNKISECFRILQAICYQHILLSAQPETTTNSRDKNYKIQMINFKKIVIQEAEKMLQDLTQIPSPHKLLSESKDYFQKIMKNIFFWKNNEDNNDKIIKKEMNIIQKESANSRNILGLQKKSNLSDNYEIGNLMTLNFKQIKYMPNVDPFYLLSNPKITELAFYATVSYFTMATETRFSQIDLVNIRTNMKIDQKYKKLNHDQRLLRCKIFHLKSIELAGKFLPPSNSFFSHLIESFNKNYKFIMDQIHEQSQQVSMKSIKLSEINQPLSSFTQYGIKETPKMKKLDKSQRSQKSTSRKRMTSNMKSNSRKKKDRSTSASRKL